MAKYTTDSSDSSDGSESETSKQTLKVSISSWLKEALNQVIRKSQANPQEAVSQPLEYAIIEWNREFERDSTAFDIPGEYIWEPDFRCIECKTANKFLFREIDSGEKNTPPTILCLNCENRSPKEEFNRLSKATEIQNKEPYELRREGTEIRHKYEGDFRTPMRFECRECKERDLILPNPKKVDCLICTRCGKRGEILEQVRGPVVKGFEKYPPDKYHSEPSPDPVGNGISRGEYDELEKAYRDGHEM